MKRLRRDVDNSLLLDEASPPLAVSTFPRQSNVFVFFVDFFLSFCHDELFRGSSSQNVHSENAFEKQLQRTISSASPVIDTATAAAAATCADMVVDGVAAVVGAGTGAASSSGKAAFLHSDVQTHVS